MNYENAPATELLATSCCCCGRPLLDAQSVTAGIGPVCAEKYGYNEVVTEAARKEANVIVHRVAAAPQAATVPADIARLFALGLTKLALLLQERLANPSISISEENGWNLFKAPYSAAFVTAIKTIPPAGRQWDSHAKAWKVLTSFKREAYWALCQVFKGETAVGPKGMFVVGI
jgi:hypothetical protein